MAERIKQLGDDRYRTAPVDEPWRKYNGLMTFPKPGGNGESRTVSPKSKQPESRERNMGICSWCSSRLHDVCASCQAEGKYRHLTPELPTSWELPPSLPPFRELVDLPAGERLAFLYLLVYYLDWQSKKE